MRKSAHVYKSISKTTETVKIEGRLTNANSQNLLAASTTSDPLAIAVYSAMAGAVAGAVATEITRGLLLRLSTFDIRWRNKRAERMLVAISVIQAGKLILMTRRKQNDQHLTWCFPAARVDKNEIITERLKARYKEKFNIEVKPIRQIGEAYIKKRDLKIIYFHCQYDSGMLENLDVQENDEVKWVDANEAENLVTTRVDVAVSKLIVKIQGE